MYTYADADLFFLFKTNCRILLHSFKEQRVLVLISTLHLSLRLPTVKS